MPVPTARHAPSHCRETVDSRSAHPFWGQNWNNNSNNVKPPFWTTALTWSVIFENILLHSLNGYLCLDGPAICVLWELSGNPFSKKRASSSGTMFTESRVSVLSEGDCRSDAASPIRVSDKAQGPMCLVTTLQPRRLTTSHIQTSKLSPTYSLTFSRLVVSERSFHPAAEIWGLEGRELDQVLCPGHLQVETLFFRTHPWSYNTGPLSYQTGPLWGREIKQNKTKKYPQAHWRKWLSSCGCGLR